MSYSDGEPHPDPVIARTMENLRDDIDAPTSQQSWLRAVLLPVCVAVLIMAIGGAAAYGYLKRDLGQTNSQLSDQVHALRDTQQKLQDTAGVATKLSDQLKQNGIKPSVAVPPVQPSAGPAGAQGAVGPVGPIGPVPSLAQIQRAVAMCFTAGQCAASPTRQQVADAVAKYCLANGRCRGPSGTTGQSGSPGSPGLPGAAGAIGATGPTGVQGAAGADGTDGKDGAQGPPPTEDQVLSAVSTYCADSSNPCQGHKGDAGYPTTITIEVPGTVPGTSRTETCTPDPDHVYTCK